MNEFDLLKEKITATNKELNKPLYLFGHTCPIIKADNTFYKIQLNKKHVVSCMKVYKEKIILTNCELKNYYELNKDDVFMHISWLFLTKEQIETYINKINFTYICAVYTDEDGIDEKFIKNEIIKNPKLLSKVFTSRREMSNNFINWLITNFQLTSFNMELLMENQILDKLNIENIILKTGNEYIPDILKYQKNYISEKFKNELLIMQKLL